jgi:hypothetical protein
MKDELKDLWFSSDYQITRDGRVWSKSRKRRDGKSIISGKWLKGFMRAGQLYYHFHNFGDFSAKVLVSRTFSTQKQEVIQPSTNVIPREEMYVAISDEQLDRIYRLKAANIKVNEIAMREGLDRKQVKEVLDEADESLIEEYTNQWEKSQQSVYPPSLDSWLRPSE